ncbi:MAG: hypothetical protein JMN27_13740 [gamma proteobacterium endosymbiont of Lamellibrachia anaximandri]|nr:hypothetical protein [gamma proteobacterium endosymbiont of Lamellibrachia anaximandri]MBL3534876.1 hypothetical protein [gamma proteobacterium endosymbiont of Lamellibrachia anaximandri]
MEFMMVRQKIKKVWEAVPPGLKRTIGFTAGVVGIAAELAAENEDDRICETAETEQLDELRETLYFDSDGDVTYEVTPARYLPGGN